MTTVLLAATAVAVSATLMPSVQSLISTGAFETATTSTAGMGASSNPALVTSDPKVVHSRWTL